ncbi:serine dehydratase subunit alpha family protein [Anaerolentibacter hominis]|uniref:L-cysteine desulfidase family protein n=1 Tax=Anaerolentibacter hominis TaxID=3079009 RepID=UPI0031B84455
MLSKDDCSKFAAIMREEMLTALGCTEPIAIAFAAAKAKEVLGEIPDRMVVECSGNIVKNAKAVIVPMTIDLRGMAAAALVGAVGGSSDLKLEVLTTVTDDDLKLTKELLDKGICEVKVLDSLAKLHIIVSCFKDDKSSKVEIMHTHDGIVHIEKNGEVIYDIPHSAEELDEGMTDRSCLTVEKILEYADTADLSEVEDLLEKQIECNSAIAKEGLTNDWGAAVGKTLIETYGNDVKIRAKAAAAAGSDARMNGCEMPVVINSGSGNQGITVSVPVIEYAKELGVSKKKLHQALVVSNLIGIHQKAKVGRLSAFCGAVSAGTAAACGIAYLQGADAKIIGQIIVNALGNVGGIVCDGAKSSCAAKIASSVEAGLIGYEMAKKGRGFLPGEGLVKSDVEKTIDSFCRMAKDGMQVTDEEILHIMVED